MGHAGRHLVGRGPAPIHGMHTEERRPAPAEGGGRRCGPAGCPRHPGVGGHPAGLRQRGHPAQGRGLHPQTALPGGLRGQAGPAPLPNRPEAVQGGSRFGQGQPGPESGGSGQREHQGGTVYASGQDPGHQPAGAGRCPLRSATVPGQRGVGQGPAGAGPAQLELDHGHLSHRGHRRNGPDPGGLPRERPERPDHGLHGGPHPRGLRSLGAAVSGLHGRRAD